MRWPPLVWLSRRRRELLLESRRELLALFMLSRQANKRAIAALALSLFVQAVTAQNGGIAFSGG